MARNGRTGANGAIAVVAGGRKAWAGVPVLDGLSLELRSGSLSVLSGAPGSGRTTVVRCLHGTLRLDTGLLTVSLRSRVIELGHVSCRDISWLQRAELSAAADDAVALPGATGRQVITRRVQRSQVAGGRAVPEALAAISALDVDDATPIGFLPPRGRRVIELARACAVQPRLLTLDAAAADLAGDPKGTAAVDLVKAIVRAGAAVLVVADPESPWRSAADQMLTLKRGRIEA